VRIFWELRRMPRWERIVLALSLTAMGGWWIGKHLYEGRAGLIVVTATPADATVLVDNVKVGDRSPVMIERRPGPYTVSVTRDGYTRSDQIVDVDPDRPAQLNVRLEGSPDTGFELTSDPPGALVWLDRAQMTNFDGSGVRTPFRAYRITPGHHVLFVQIGRFQSWSQDIEIPPGTIIKVHATPVPRAAPRGRCGDEW
jgi:hypothetical protein